MPNLDRLAEFAAVAETLSISSAAREIGIERSTLSRRMTRLETELGVRLLHRSTAGLTLTAAGDELNQRARQIVDDAEDAWGAVRRMDDVPRGVLRVSMVGDMLDDMMTRYVLDFPEVRIELVDTSRPVHLISERIDVAVRFGPVNDVNLITRKVHAGVDRIVVAAPSYIKGRGLPRTATDLAKHECVGGANWPLREGGRVTVNSRVGASESRLIRQACLAGVGLAFLPVPLVHDDVMRGALVPILPEIVGDTAQIRVVFADRRYVDAKVRVFIERAVPALEEGYGRYSQWGWASRP